MDLPIHTDEETLVILGVDTHASPTWAEIVSPKTRLAPNTRLSRASARVSRRQPSPSHRASHERRGGGGVGDPAVQSELLSVSLGGLADVLEPAGDEQASAERPEPALPPKLPEVRRHHAGRREPSQRRSPVLNRAALLGTTSWRRAYRCASLDAPPQTTEAGSVQTLSESGTLRFHHDSLHTLILERAARFLCEAVPKVTEGWLGGFWHFWHPVG
jgi:hypothetical protein